jgi:hypothetical protein
MSNDNHDLIMETIAEKVSAGKCILFLGAAVHYPPPNELVIGRADYVYPENHRPPLGSALSKLLAQRARFEQRFPNERIDNLQRVAQDFETTKSRPELVNEIRNAVQTGKRPSPLLHKLANLNFPIVITTNYDDLFEEALRLAGKRPFVSVYKNNVERDVETDDFPFDRELTPDKPFIFKIHGDINEGESIVITEEDYIHFILRMSDKHQFHPIPETIHYYLKKWSTLFIGYSLRDYNLRLLFKTLRWKVDKAKYPLSYSVDISPDPLTLRVLTHQVTFLAQDVWKFVPELYEIVKQNRNEDL